MIKDEELILVLAIIKYDKCSNRLDHILNIDMVKHSMSGVCKQLYFDIVDSTKLIVVSMDKIIKFDFFKEEKEDFYDFQTDFNE